MEVTRRGGACQADSVDRDGQVARQRLGEGPSHWQQAECPGQVILWSGGSRRRDS